MNLTDYRRFFAFGCSFTNYYWPTWANIIAQDIHEHYNYGQMAAGNNFIFHQLIEAQVRHQFTKHDLVMVMWSIPLREDRYVEKWHLLKSHPTAFGLRGLGTPEYYSKYCSEYGSLLRDLTNITAAQGMLESTGCDHHFMAVQPLNFLSHTGAKYDFNFSFKPDDDIQLLCNFFHATLAKIKPSVYELIFNCQWRKTARVIRPDGKSVYDDWHPLPADHLNYLERVFADINLSDYARNYVNTHQQAITNNQPFQHKLNESTYVQLTDLKGQKISWPDGS